MPIFVLLILPYALVALAVAVPPWALVWVVLRWRCPAVRLLPASAAIVPAMLWCVGGLAACVLAALAVMRANPDPQDGIGVLFLGAMAFVAFLPWLAVLTTLGAAAGRRGAASMHLTLVVMAIAGVAGAVASPILIMMIDAIGLLFDEVAEIAITIAALPLGSAIAALALAPFLPVGRFGKVRCMNCGYDLAGLPPRR